MKAIHADPKDVRKIFSDTYIIPDFQRPYSWNEEQCEKLWEDFADFLDKKQSKEDKYFLGNIVIHEDKEGAYAVIDGQQRLTTMLLFIKALHNKAATVKALDACLRIKDPLTDELTDKPRIDSRVVANDKNDILNIINGNFDQIDNSSKFKINFNLFDRKLEGWRVTNPDSGKFNDLILTLLDQIVLLPIHCGSEDDALTIFETLNNRGMALTDADIFKAKLYQKAQDKEEFIVQWNNLDDHEWLFRIYMHIKRAQEDDTSKETALRSYFTDSVKNRLSNCDETMKSLAVIHDITNNWEGSSEVTIFWRILESYPNQYWNFPLYVFLHKYGKIDTDEYNLSDENLKTFIDLLKETTKYLFIEGVVHNSVNTVKDTIFKVCASIEKKEDYLKHYVDNLSENDLTEFNKRIRANQYGRCQKGLVLLSSALNPQQNQDDFKYLLDGKFDIEHILPKKWNNYDKWIKSSWEENLNTIGNLMPLEKALNISASNEFFERKKLEYQKSKVQDAKDLTRQGSTWYPENLVKNHNEKMERLLKFFNVPI
jgi:hypothetical protein